MASTAPAVLLPSWSMLGALSLAMLVVSKALATTHQNISHCASWSVAWPPIAAPHHDLELPVTWLLLQS